MKNFKTFVDWLNVFIPNSQTQYTSGIKRINSEVLPIIDLPDVEKWSLDNWSQLHPLTVKSKAFIDADSGSYLTYALESYKKFLISNNDLPTLSVNNWKWQGASGTPTSGYNSPYILCEVVKLFHRHERGAKLNDKLLEFEEHLRDRNKFKEETTCSLVLSGERDVLTQFGPYWQLYSLTEIEGGSVSLTSMGAKVAEEKMNITEFIDYQIKHISQNNKDGSINSLKLIIDLLGELNKIDSSQAYIRMDRGKSGILELVYILPYIYLGIFSLRNLANAIIYFRQNPLENKFREELTINELRFIEEEFLFLLFSEKLSSSNDKKYKLKLSGPPIMTKPLESASKIVESEEIKSILKMAEFYFEKGQQELTNLKSHSMLDEKYLALFDDYKSKKIDILCYLDLNADPIEKAYLEKVLKFYSYVDMNSPGKNSYNDYIDKRVVTRMSLWTRSWFQGITKFKSKGNDINELTLDSNLYNAIYYLEKPEESFPIVSRKHKANISLNLLGKPYDESYFAKDIIAFFEPLNLDITNEENLTVILSKIIYDYNFRGFWDIIPQQITDKFISEFMKYLVSQNLIFDEKLIARFICSLATKPFLILTGNSGTGKSRIALEFAKWINFNQSEEKKHVLVPVGADWTDKRPIFGFYNPLTEKYISTPILEMILEAEQDEDSPYFLILDEMNLSHVERYFSDFLSILESPTESITLHESGDSAPCSGNDRSIPNKLFLPKNLFVIGTVNIDETTYMFSPKVLDRANVIEISASINDLKEFTPKPTAKYKLEHDCFSAFLNLSLTARGYLLNDKYNEIDSKTIKIGVLNYFQILQNHDLEFGFRTLNEAINYFKVRKTINKTVSIHETLSEQVVQKFITKLNGSRAKLERLLVELYILSKIYDDKKATITEGDVKKVSEKLKDYTSLSKVFEDDAVVTNLASVKIKKMTKKLNREQFVSFI